MASFADYAQPVGHAISAVVGAAVSRRERIAAENMTRHIRKEDRQWGLEDREYARGLYLADRKNERDHANWLTSKDRAHAAKLLEQDRKYTRDVFKEDRRYDRKTEIDDRIESRQYLAKRLAGDRAFAEQEMLKDRREFTADRDAIQRNSELLAEKSAASRGIDFKRLVADAQSAGFNPLTAMSMAHAYSTNVDYADTRQAYSNRAGFQVNGASYLQQGGGGGGGGGAGTSAVPTSSPITSGGVAAGGFVAPGAGSTASSSPAMSSGAFVADAIARGVDSWFNRPPEKDALAESLRAAIQLGERQSAVQSAQIPQGFGYDLTRQEPFRPRAGVTTPVLRPKGTELRPPAKPGSEGQTFIPVRNPAGDMGRLDKTIARRLGIRPGDTVSAGDWEEIVGETGAIETGIFTDPVRRTATGDGIFDLRDTDGPTIKPGTDEFLNTGTRRYQPDLSPWSW